MRRFLFLAAFLVSLIGCLNANAQVQWTAPKMVWYQQIPLDCKIIKVDFDYSNAMLRSMSYGDNAAAFEDFENDVKEAEGKFISVFNDYAVNRKKMFCLSRTTDAEYVLYVVPAEIKKNGSFYGNVVIKNRDGEVIAIMENVSARGGTFGTFCNLMSDGYDSLAEIIRAEIWRTRAKMK